MHACVACLVPLPACLVRGVHGTVALERLRLIPVIERSVPGRHGEPSRRGGTSVISCPIWSRVS